MDEEFPKLVANPGNPKNTKQDKKTNKKIQSQAYHNQTAKTPKQKEIRGNRHNIVKQLHFNKKKKSQRKNILPIRNKDKSYSGLLIRNHASKKREIKLKY